MPKIAERYSLKEFFLHACRKNSDMHVGIFPKLAICHSRKKHKSQNLCALLLKSDLSEIKAFSQTQTSTSWRQNHRSCNQYCDHLHKDEYS